MFQGIDHHWKENVYATCGDRVDVWQEDRSEPVRSFQWGVDTVHSVKFNPVEVMLAVLKYIPDLKGQLL